MFLAWTGTCGRPTRIDSLALFFANGGQNSTRRYVAVLRTGEFTLLRLVQQTRRAETALLSTN